MTLVFIGARLTSSHPYTTLGMVSLERAPNPCAGEFTSPDLLQLYDPRFVVVELLLRLL